MTLFAQHRSAQSVPSTRGSLPPSPRCWTELNSGRLTEGVDCLRLNSFGRSLEGCFYVCQAACSTVVIDAASVCMMR